MAASAGCHRAGLIHVPDVLNARGWVGQEPEPAIILRQHDGEF